MKPKDAADRAASSPGSAVHIRARLQWGGMSTWGKQEIQDQEVRLHLLLRAAFFFGSSECNIFLCFHLSSNNVINILMDFRKRYTICYTCVQIVI